MNAKKIMGAVLVALLAAALFVGAGAAAATPANGDTVFVYELVSKVDGAAPTGTWAHANGVDTLVFTEVDTDVYAIVGDKIVEGTYTKGAGDDAVSITVKYPTAGISAVGSKSPVTYNVIGGSYYKVDGYTLAVKLVDGPVAAKGIAIIGADGIAVPAGTTLDQDDFTKEGTYKLVAYYFIDGTDFVSTAPANFVYNGNNVLLGKDVYTITIVDGADPTITAVADSVIAENTIDVVITGLPGAEYKITANGFDVPTQAAGVVNGVFTMPNTGTVTVTLKALDKTGDFTITVTPKSVGGDEAEVDIEIVGGTITAVADKDAYYIGNDVTITGTSTAGATVYFYLAGTNIGFIDLDVTADVKNGEFKKEFEGYFKDLDAGTYTLYVSATEDATEVKGLNTYATVALVLKQPFISVTDAPSVAVKGSTFKVKGTAEAADDVYAYIFGTNFFAANNKDNDGCWPAFLADDFVVKVKNNEFTIEVDIPAESANMSAGQYFMIIQHPMYDEVFNVAPFLEMEDGEDYGYPYITMNVSGEATATSPVVVDVFGRQKANAAQALCENLDSENIDDMYVKLSFIVGAPQSVINPIPSEIVKGEKLTVSGTTNVGEGEVVTVELLSTAFAAVPKSTVGSASFISLVTKTDENGNWEVTFDTSGLNVDEYTVTAAIEQLGSSATAKVNVVEAADKPDTPVDPVDPVDPKPVDPQPTEPETPGFGALAALAGLGAVAVLLLRRE